MGICWWEMKDVMKLEQKASQLQQIMIDFEIKASCMPKLPTYEYDASSWGCWQDT